VAGVGILGQARWLRPYAGQAARQVRDEIQAVIHPSGTMTSRSTRSGARS